MLTRKVNTCIAATLALGFSLSTVSAQDNRQEPEPAECKKMRIGRFSTDIIQNELKAVTKSGNRAGSCIVSCIAVEHYSQLSATAQSCQNAAKSGNVKLSAKLLAEQSSASMREGQTLLSSYCERGCPDNLPTIDQTPFGVAAAYKSMNGDVTPDQVRAIVRNSIAEMSKNGKLKFEKMPLSQYEVNTYACAYGRAYEDSIRYQVLRQSTSSLDIFVSIADCVQGDK